jgi:hypothetical protein
MAEKVSTKHHDNPTLPLGRDIAKAYKMLFPEECCEEFRISRSTFSYHEDFFSLMLGFVCYRGMVFNGYLHVYSVL